MHVKKFTSSNMMKFTVRDIITIAIILAIILSAFVISETKENGDWSQMGHDARHTGKSSAHLSGGTKALLWRKTYPIFMCEDRRDQILYYHGIVYHYIGDFFEHIEGDIEAVNPKSGKVLWIKPFAMVTDFAIAQNTIYLAGMKALYALDLNGNLKWKQQLGDGCEFITVGEDGMLYCNNRTLIYSIYPTETGGTSRWVVNISDGISGRISQYGNVIYFVTSNRGEKYLYALNSYDGSVNWKYRIPVNGSAFSPSVDIEGNVYFVVNSNSSSYMFSVNSFGKMRWATDLGTKYVFGRKAIDDDLSTIYVITSYNGNKIWSLDLHTGKIKWKEHVNFGVYDFVIGDDGTLYVHSYNSVYALDPDGNEKWSFKIISTRYFFGPPQVFYNTILVTNNFVFVVSIEQFYAIGIDNQDGLAGFNVLAMTSAGVGVAAVASIVFWRIIAIAV